MNKAMLIGGLAVITVAVVGAIAFFLMTRKPQQAAVNPPVQPLNIPSVTPAAQTSIPVTQTQNEIKLVITSPATNTSVVKVARQKISGQTVPGADVSINEVAVKADTKGNFSAYISLYEGENPVFITAVDETGAFSEQELTITYQP